MVQMTSVLYIWPVLDIHAGSYQCIASNVLGTSYSTKAVVTVSGKQAGLFLPITCVVPAFDESLGKCYYTICNYITMSFTCKQTFSRLYKHQHKDNSILHLLTWRMWPIVTHRKICCTSRGILRSLPTIPFLLQDPLHGTLEQPSQPREEHVISGDIWIPAQNLSFHKSWLAS